MPDSPVPAETCGTAPVSILAPVNDGGAEAVSDPRPDRPIGVLEIMPARAAAEFSGSSPMSPSAMLRARS